MDEIFTEREKYLRKDNKKVEKIHDLTSHERFFVLFRKDFIHRQFIELKYCFLLS